MCDLGLAKAIGRGGRTYTYCGTDDFVAPEIFETLPDGARAGYGIEADWWAFGVLFMEMVCGDVPFHGEDARAVVRHAQATLANGTFPSTSPLRDPFVIPSDAADLITQARAPHATVDSVAVSLPSPSPTLSSPLSSLSRRELSISSRAGVQCPSRQPRLILASPPPLPTAAHPGFSHLPRSLSSSWSISPPPLSPSLPFSPLLSPSLPFSHRTTHSSNVTTAITAVTTVTVVTVGVRSFARRELVVRCRVSGAALTDVPITFQERVAGAWRRARYDTV